MAGVFEFELNENSRDDMEDHVEVDELPEKEGIEVSEFPVLSPTSILQRASSHIYFSFIKKFVIRYSKNLNLC